MTINILRYTTILFFFNMNYIGLILGEMVSQILVSIILLYLIQVALWYEIITFFFFEKVFFVKSFWSIVIKLFGLLIFGLSLI